jgi:hypothetical protein
MSVVLLAILLIGSTVFTVVVIGALLIWAARKDGQDNDALQQRLRDAGLPDEHAPRTFPPVARGRRSPRLASGHVGRRRHR